MRDARVACKLVSQFQGKEEILVQEVVGGHWEKKGSNEKGVRHL